MAFFQGVSFLPYRRPFELYGGAANIAAVRQSELSDFRQPVAGCSAAADRKPILQDVGIVQH